MGRPRPNSLIWGGRVLKKFARSYGSLVISWKYFTNGVWGVILNAFWLILGGKHFHQFLIFFNDRLASNTCKFIVVYHGHFKNILKSHGSICKIWQWMFFPFIKITDADFKLQFNMPPTLCFWSCRIMGPKYIFLTRLL